MKHFKAIIFVFILVVIVSCGTQKRYVSYTMKKGETVEGIASKLKVDANELLRLNPDITTDSGENTVIIIPSTHSGSLIQKTTTKESEQVGVDKETESSKKEEIINTAKEDEKVVLKGGVVYHHVKKGDTFYSLTRFYNVTKEELLHKNPNLIDGLKAETTILIKEIKPENVRYTSIYKDSIDEDTSINAVLMLPFNAAKYDSLSSNNIFQKNAIAHVVTDFYMGATIAIDSLRKQGIPINLEVFDTGSRKNSKVKSILSANDNFSEVDIVIGPLYSDEVKVVANKLNAPVVFPFYSKKQNTFSSSRIVKATPDNKMYKEAMLQYLYNEHKGENIIIVGDGKAKSNADILQIKASFKNEKITVLKPSKGYIQKRRFLEILKKDIKNWIILVASSNDVSSISNAISNLISLPKGIEVQVFCVNKNDNHKNIDSNKLAKIGFTFGTETYSDEESFATKNFNQHFLQKNKALPTYHATKGFDITYDALIRLASSKKLKETFKEGVSYRIENKFDYTKDLFNIITNKGVFIVRFNEDLSLTRLK